MTGHDREKTMRRIVTAGFVVFAMLGGTSFAQDAKVQKGMQV